MPLSSALHDAAMQRYRKYLVDGGLPECVLQFIQTHNYVLVRHTQVSMLVSYLNDMSKYNSTVQFSKRNTRFQFKLIKKGGRSTEFEKAIEWLCLSGIASQVYTMDQVCPSNCVLCL